MFASLPNPLPTGRHWKVELGCGKRKAMEGAIVGVDIRDFGQEIVADLEETPWIWAEDESCGLVVCHQTLEHIRDLLPVMAEIWRICEPGAHVEIVVPYGVGKVAIQDPTHVRFFTEDTFRYWEPDFIEPWGDYGIRHHFAICSQLWREGANLWALLYPLKTEHDLKAWRALRARALEQGHGLVTWEAPLELLERAEGLLGETATSGRA